MSVAKNLLSGLLAACMLGAPAVASAADSTGSPGLEALDEFRTGRSRVPAIQNRFFLKQGRFEITPSFGYVPNNAFSKRYVGGLLFAYHFSERLAASGSLSYSPDLGQGDLKGLTGALVRIAYNGPGGSEFQQPLHKTTLAANFVAQWTPLYGKINLVGHAVINFEFYGVAGLGMLSQTNYFAKYNPDPAVQQFPFFVDMIPQGNEVQIAPTVGVGSNFFLTQTVALRVDARSGFYVDDKPVYNQGEAADGTRLYNHLVVSGGVSLFFPKMKPRLYNF